MQKQYGYRRLKNLLSPFHAAWTPSHFSGRRRPVLPLPADFPPSPLSPPSPVAARNPAGFFQRRQPAPHLQDAKSPPPAALAAPVRELTSDFVHFSTWEKCTQKYVICKYRCFLLYNINYLIYHLPCSLAYTEAKPDPCAGSGRVLLPAPQVFQNIRPRSPRPAASEYR